MADARGAAAVDGHEIDLSWAVDANEQDAGGWPVGDIEPASLVLSKVKGSRRRLHQYSMFTLQRSLNKLVNINAIQRSIN